MITITLKYGLTKEVTREISPNATVSQVLADPNNKAILGYPENVTAVVDGVSLGANDNFGDGDVVILEKQAAQKA